MNKKTASLRRQVMAGVFLMSAAALTLEISLTRIFSFVIWYHFAFMIISIALLGFGVSGIFLTLNNKARDAGPATVCTFSAALFSLSVICAYFIVTRFPFDPTGLGQSWTPVVLLTLNFIALTVPFFFAGTAIAKTIMHLPKQVNRVYFSDLLGGGIGCLSVIILIPRLGGSGMIFFAALAGMLAAVCFSLSLRRAATSLLAAAALSLLVLTLAADSLFPIMPAHNRSTSRNKTLTLWTDRERFPNSKHTFSAWNAYSRVDVVENCGSVTWLYNPRYPGLPLPSTNIVIDGDAATSIIDRRGGAFSTSFAQVTPSALPHQLLRPQTSLIIGAGGGVDVFTALNEGSRRIDAVEINPIIVDLVTGRYASLTGNLFSRPEVRLHVGEGRNFVRSTAATYDLIQLSLIDTWAALSSGAYSLSESYLYTREAFQDYYRRLTEDGALTITRWLWRPPRETLKLCSVGMSAMEGLGVENPEKHFVVYAMGNFASMIMKRSPFSLPEVERLREICSKRGFRVLYDPFTPRDNAFQGLFSATDRAGFYEKYPFDLAPSSDNKPFFFLHYKWRDLSLKELYDGSSLLAFPGKLLLLVILVLSTLLAAVLLLLPLLLKKKGRIGWREGSPFLVYFFGIGVAFMFLEIVLMQKFSLFLGHPVYAISLVLFSLLVFSGVGSLLSFRLVGDSPGRLAGACALLAGGIFLSFLLYPALFEKFIGAPFSLRLAVALAAIIPLSVLMGIPFPSGIRQADRSNSRLIPWAWGVNGLASVISSTLSVLLATQFGFSAVASLAGGIYLMAGLVLLVYAPQGTGVGGGGAASTAEAPVSDL